MTRALILCAGDGTRWANYLDVPKQLAPVDDVPILARTIRQLQACGVVDIKVVVKPSEQEINTVAIEAGAEVHIARLESGNFEADRFASSRHLWNPDGRTLVLYGDVYYTEEAMSTIVFDERREWQVYGRPKASRLTGCGHGEIFAFSWYPEEYPLIDAKIEYVIGLRQSGVINRALGWELYRALLGRQGIWVRKIKGTSKTRMTRIDDWTDDFDKPKNYETWLYRRANRSGSVSVLIPYRSDGAERDRNWAYLRERWQRHFPEWEIVVGTHQNGGWSKGAALWDAFNASSGSTIVIADADVWTSGVQYAVDKINIRSNTWAVPHQRVKRLTADATEQVMVGDLRFDRIKKVHLDRDGYTGIAGGGLTVMHRDLYEAAPIDPRFIGWGQEDQAAGHAWTTLAGRPWRGYYDLFHLWHPPQAKMGRTIGSKEGYALKQRYAGARNQKRRMVKLIEEFRPLLDTEESHYGT